MTKVSDKTQWDAILTALEKAAQGDYSFKIESPHQDNMPPRVAQAINLLLEKTKKQIDGLEAFVADQARDARRYRHMLDSMEESYFEVDLKGNLEFFNDTVVRDTGYSEAELAGMNFKQLAESDSLEKVYNMFHQVFLTGQSVKGFDWIIRKKDGATIDVEPSVALLRDAAGKPSGFRGVVRDITGRKLAEQALVASRQKYRDILENMEETYLEINLRGNFLFFNNSFCRVLGYSRAELQGADYRLITPRENLESVRKIFTEIYRSGKRKNFFNHRLIAKDGSDIYLEMSMSLLRSPSGEPTGFAGVGRDVTERLAIQRQIIESERHLRLITDNIRDVIWTMDFNWNYTYVSPSIYHLIGFTSEEVKRVPFKDSVPPDIFQKMQQGLADALALEAGRDGSGGRESRIYEVPLRRKDGKRVWTEVRSNFNRDENGKPFELVGVVRDITERKKIQDALAESEKRHRLIAENIDDVIWTMDFDLNWSYLSPSLERLTGFTAEEILHIPVRAMLPPDTYTQIKQRIGEELAKEKDLDVLAKREPVTLEMQLMRKNGSFFWAELSANFNRDENGIPFEIVGVTRNISERKKTEETLRNNEQRYRIMSENVNDIVWILGLDLRFIYVTPSNARISGYTTEEVMAMTLADFLTPASLQTASSLLAEELAREQSGETVDPNRSRSLEMEVYTKEGKKTWLEINATFNRDAQGKPTEILAVGRNITERRTMQMELAESERRYRLIAENVNDIIWTIGLDLKFLYVSPSSTRVTGYAPEEAMSHALDQVLTPDSYAWATKRLAEELERQKDPPPDGSNRPVTLELEAVHKDGSLFWLEVTGTFNRNAEGAITEILAVGRNITERKKVQQSLQESERLYRMIVENMHDSISLYDMNLNSVYQSPSEIKVTGYTAEEIMNMPIEKQMPPPSYALVQQIFAEEMDLEFSGKPVDPNRSRTIELEAYHKNGSTIWEEITASFNRDANGSPVNIILTSRDITARKKAEIALQESEKRYRMIIENVHGSIALLDLNFDYIYLSPSEEKMTGYKPEEMINIPLQDQMTPESYARIEKIFAEELELEFSGNPVDPDRSRTMELEVYHKNGGTIWEELTAAFTRDENGRPTGLMITTRNVTERIKAEEKLKRSEHRYRMIIENMHEVIWTTDLSMNSTYVSPSCFSLTGYTPDEILNMPPDRIVAPESMAETAAIVMEEIQREFSGQAVDPQRTRTIEQELLCKNGATVWLEVTGAFIRDEEGKAVGMLMAGRDITERKKTEEEKLRLEQQLVQAQKMETVGRLAGGVAHDFNNMLSVILGYVDLAKMRLARQHPVLKDVAEIEKAALRSRDITMQLLAFSRKQVIEPKIIDLCDLVASTQKALARLIGEDIDLRVISGENVGTIKIDPSQVEQILINLAVNSRDAMPQGGKLMIEIVNATLDEAYCQTHIGATPGNYVRMSVSDNGSGMDKETITQIFEPFFTTKEAGKGTGLGLATVYGIVKQNDGFISVYSELGHGTTFTLYFPRTTEAIEEDETPQEPDLQMTGSGRILLVEDDPMVLAITRGMLESIGYSVTATGYPKDAVKIFTEAREPFDLVITDVVMPSMSGKDLKNKLVEITPDVKMLFMSGYTADIIAHHGILEEGIHFLQKPFSIQALAQKVAEML